MTVYERICGEIGHTPLLSAAAFSRALGLKTPLLCKLEGKNPLGSAKDRVAREILRAAEREGRLTPDSVVIEPTSGNTGIALAALCAARGIRCIIVMPENMSAERRRLLTAYGAELVLTDGARGMAASIARAEELSRTVPHAWIAGQFTSPHNPAAHYKTTGPEIWDDTDGTADAFVAGIGTGGTISGVGRYLKEKSPAVRVIGVEPADSPVLTEGRAGPHGLAGIGAGFVPATLDRRVIDEICTVTEEEARDMCRLFARTEMTLVGISSGAALAAAARHARWAENQNKKTVVLLPDSGERYLSTPLFDLESGERV